LVVTTPACLATTFSASATRSVVGSAERTLPGSLVIDVSPNLAPLTASTPFSMGFGYDAGVASGAFVVDANCPVARVLTASVELTLVDGGVGARQTFPAPGPWSLPFTEGCAGGTFTATARLFEQGKDTGAIDRTTSFTAPAQTVTLGTITPTQFTASCGGGASGTVAVALAEGSCEAAKVTWSQRSGPAITQTSQGRSLTFQTVASGFEVVGTTLGFDAVVSAGVGNQATASAELSIGAPRFVAFAHHLEPLQPTAEDLITATVTVTNQSACLADQLVVSELATDLVPDSASAKLDGRPIAAQTNEHTLVVAPFALEGHQTRLLTFSARPRLLGRLTLQGGATLRGVPVEVTVEAAPPVAACGCSTVDASLGLLGLLAWRRRRAKAA
jgi:hypothetical protein